MYLSKGSDLEQSFEKGNLILWYLGRGSNANILHSADQIGKKREASVLQTGGLKKLFESVECISS